MIISPIQVIAWIHPGPEVAIPYQAPRLHLVNNQEMAVQWNGQHGETGKQLPEIASERFRFTKCMRCDQCGTSAVSCEIQRLVNLTLDGYNTTAVFLTVGSAANAAKLRKDILYNLINRLGVELKNLNSQRKKNRLSEIQLDYAYLGIVDNYCYDLRAGCRVENSSILKDGIDPFMRRIKHTDTIWSKVREGTTVPYALYLRLTDEAQFMGTMMIADLLQPEFQEPITIQPACTIYSSFGLLRSLLHKVASSSSSRIDDSETELSELNSSVLTSLLIDRLSGIGRAVVFMHFSESLYADVKEVLEALKFAQLLQSIRCIAVQNKLDIRVKYYRKRLQKASSESAEAKATLVQCRTDLEQANSTIFKLQKEIDGHKAKISILDGENTILKDILSRPHDRRIEAAVQTDNLPKHASPHEVQVKKEKYLLSKAALQECVLKERIRCIRVRLLSLVREHLQSGNQMPTGKKLLGEDQEPSSPPMAFDGSSSDSICGARAAVDEETSFEVEFIRENESLKHQLEEARTETRQNAEQWAAERGKLQQEILENKAKLLHVSMDLKRQKDFRNEYKYQARQYKKQANETKVRLEEALAWSNQKTIDSENERNQIRRHIHTLREQLIESIPLLSTVINRNGEEQYAVDEEAASSPELSPTEAEDDVPQFSVPGASGDIVLQDDSDNDVSMSSQHSVHSETMVGPPLPLMVPPPPSDTPFTAQSTRGKDVRNKGSEANSKAAVRHEPQQQFKEKPKVMPGASQPQPLPAVGVSSDKEQPAPLQPVRENIKPVDKIQKQGAVTENAPTAENRRGEALQPKDENAGGVMRAKKRRRILDSLKGQGGRSTSGDGSGPSLDPVSDLAKGDTI